uniref:Uncharacterized protein n=1 Tax=Ciona intestinalis TaxID=7719 RepID=H2XLT5_CIOIN
MGKGFFKMADISLIPSHYQFEQAACMILC